MIHINIGSNLNSTHGSRDENISMAVKQLINNKIKIMKISDFYETPSYPNKNNPSFLNAGLLIDTNSNPTSLLNDILIIEKKLGRIRSKKNAPRTCDIDIIDFDRKVKNFDNLHLPHPKCHARNFVLYPIKEIDPDWIHPVLKKNVDFLINELTQTARIEITRLNKRVII
tara:strand:+ start:1028 stop:1537 length:510 start_codon:yes stop_codon:yes gene_type:complete